MTQVGTRISAADDALRTAAQVTRWVELADAPMRHLVRALDGCGAFLIVSDADNALHVECATDERFVGVQGEYHERFFGRDPVHAILHDEQPWIWSLNRYRQWREFRERRAFADFMGRADCFTLLGIRLNNARYLAPGMVAAMVVRHRAQLDYTQQDELLAARILPAFEAAVARCARFAAESRVRASLEGMLDDANIARLALDMRGRLLWMSSAAEELLRQGVDRGTDGVPSALAEAARTLTASVAEDRRRQPRFTVTLVQDDATRVEAELHLARASSGDPFVAVRLDEHGLPVSFQAEGAARGLTAAETTVLAHLVLGLTNRQIAERLYVSTNTVRTHVGHILSKLGVDARAKAVALAMGWLPASEVQRLLSASSR